MGHCKDCKWYDTETYDGIVYRTQWDEWGQCELAAFEFNYPKHDDSLAVVLSDGIAVLKVSPDFGCVQFEASEEIDE